MRHHPSRRRLWQIVAAMAAMLLVSCAPGDSAGTNPYDSLGQSVVAAESAINRAVLAAGSSGAAEARSSADLSLAEFRDAADAIELDDASLEEQLRYFDRSGAYVLALLAQGEAAQAANAQKGDLAAVADDLRASLVRKAASVPESAGTTTPVGQIIGAGILVVVALATLRWLVMRGTSHGSVPEPVASAASAARAQLPALSQESAQGQEARAGRPTPRSADLRGVIEAAVASVENTGWRIAVHAPEMDVLVDPLRLRTVLGNLLMSATLHGARHIGVVAELDDGKVYISIGDDGDISHDGPDVVSANPGARLPQEVDHQLTVANSLLEASGAEVSWMRVEGVSLYVVELQPSPETLSIGA